MAIRAVWGTDWGFWELGLDFFSPIWFLFIRNTQFLVVLKDIVYKIGIFVLKFCFLWVPIFVLFLGLFCLLVWVNGEDTLWLTLLLWIKIISNTQFQFVDNNLTFSFFSSSLWLLSDILFKKKKKFGEGVLGGDWNVNINS